MDKVRDPVCGMLVDPAETTASSEYEGQTYYFCSTECKETFDASPARYAITDEGPRFTKSMGFPAPKFGSSTSGGAEYEPPSLTEPVERRSKKRSS